MPLKAIIDGEPVIGALMDQDAWKQLGDGRREGKIEIRLPCCNHLAIPRTSKLGTQHFYHRPNSDCNRRPESLEHLLLKEKLLRGSITAGWQADVEVDGDGFRSDVMATDGRRKIAFEVQWSRVPFAIKVNNSDYRLGWIS